MSMKLTWTKDELTRRSGQYWWTCGICQRGSSSKNCINHTLSCPFSDDTVEALTFTVGPEHDSEICGRCGFTSDQCPVMTVDGGWDMVTHERLQAICANYAAAAAEGQL